MKVGKRVRSESFIVKTYFDGSGRDTYIGYNTGIHCKRNDERFLKKTKDRCKVNRVFL